MTGFLQGEILSGMDEKSECLGREDHTMNLANLLRRYAGISLQPTGGTQILAQTSALLILKPAQAVQPDESTPRTNSRRSHCQIAESLPAAAIDEALVKRESEPVMQRGQPCNGIAEPQPARLSWQAQLDRWPQEGRDLWEERAAIMEVEGGLSRDEAERQAFELLRDNPSHPEYGVMASDVSDK